MSLRFVTSVLLLCLLLVSCKYEIDTNRKANEAKASAGKNLLKDISAKNEDGTINAIIEIPAGGLEKWELNKSNGKIERDYADGKPRTIDYLGYPANYGLIPQTLLSKENGGDGDPLDVIVLGPSIVRGSIVKAKLIGVLRLKDRGEQDDKLVAVSSGSPQYELNDIHELSNNYEGLLDIIEVWFSNYKGPGKMQSDGYGNKAYANKILQAAIEDFQNEGK